VTARDVHPDDRAGQDIADRQADRPARRGRSTDIPKIRLLSWLGLECILWGLVIGHLVKWDGNTGYYGGIQTKYSMGSEGWYIDWFPKDLWDRLPVHISNVFGLGWFPGPHPQHWAPLGWVLDRHGIRDMTIGFVGTVVLTLIFTKPKYPADDVVAVRQYFKAAGLVTLVWLLSVGVLMFITWKLVWMQEHGVQVPARYGQAATEFNGWFAAGLWVSTLVGIVGGVVAKLFVRRVADDIQWFFGERSAAKIRSTSGLNALRGTRVYGTPPHRKRVRWLLEHKPTLPERSPWLVRFLLFVAFWSVVGAGIGAWLTLAGPAAVR
jgi:hypothetical protein